MLWEKLLNQGISAKRLSFRRSGQGTPERYGR